MTLVLTLCCFSGNSWSLTYGSLKYIKHVLIPKKSKLPNRPANQSKSQILVHKKSPPGQQQKITNLDFAVESFAGKFSHRLTVTTRAFLSKLYRIVQWRVPRTWLGSDGSTICPEVDDLLNVSTISVVWSRTSPTSSPVC